MTTKKNYKLGKKSARRLDELDRQAAEWALRKLRGWSKAKLGQAAPTVGRVARGLILMGLTDEQTFDVLRQLYKMTSPAQQHYAGWYRAQLVRTGRLSRSRADETRHKA